MDGSSKGERFTTRALHIALFLLALSAPISIAATQTAWSLAILFWLVRLIFVRPKFRIAGIDIAILVFISLTLVSSIFSYEPEVSLRKMVPVSLVSIVYLVSEYTTTRRIVHRLVAIVLISCFAASLYAFVTLAVGKNLKVLQLAADSPLRQAGVAEGYTILKANGINVNSPDELYLEISQHSADGVAAITVYRHELIDTYKLPATNFPPNIEGLGIVQWSRGRDTRASGFYGQFITFAEALQLIASLALGLFISLSGTTFSRNRILLGIALAAYILALFLTITRASWLSFLISAAVMVLLGESRRTALICVALAILFTIAGLFYLQQKREVGFIDTSDESTAWRLRVWRDGSNLLVSNPRHLAVGIGMDSIKNHYLEWHLFDDGRQPIGHMHSTPLQLALERGVPTLIAWIIWMCIYLRMLWRKLKKNDLQWIDRGILLGAFGGTIGFLTSGLVHYNWGDSEVAMIFYLITGFSLCVIRNLPANNANARE
jgi:membrane-associated protease RseP (regulator of RpoE activity)